MSRIELLDEITAGRIAAGEVVIRPASVIKELIENSIDAGATNITVEIESGGMKTIAVTDNGSGIHPDDVEIAFMRHATSKIKNGDTLAEINSLGFRGEALFSIAAVSRVNMTTRLKDALYGMEIEVNGGKIERISVCGCPDGTSVIVRDLFYNTPARLKFISSFSAEAAQASDIVLRMILLRPDISIRFINNGKTIYHSPGTGALNDAIQSVYGKQISDKLIKIDYDNGDMSVNGFIGLPETARNSRSFQSLFVNGRYIKNSTLSFAVQNGYGQSLMTGKFAFFVISINIQTKDIDVNVHPQKLEVRFSKQRTVSDALQYSVQKALSKSGISAVPNINLPEQNGSEIVKSRTDKIPSYRISQHFQSDLMRFYNEKPTVLKESTGLLSEQSVNNNNYGKQAAFDSFVTEEAKVLGQVFGTYVLVQSNDTLFIIDQHAAHERLNFNEYMRQYQNSLIASQQLLAPVVVELTFSDMEKYEELGQSLKKIGFDVDVFGDRQIAVRAIPQVLSGSSIQKLVSDTLDEINEAESKLPGVEEKLIRAACRHSIKANDALSQTEMEHLLYELKSNEKLTCPHGRPIAVKITKHDLEKGFKRII